MSRAVLVLHNDAMRAKAARWCMGVKPGVVVEFREPKRTNEQNALLWALLGDVSRQVVWNGQKLEPEDWKVIFMHGLNREMRFAPSIDGKGFVPLGYSSSKLSVGEFSDLIELIYAFGAQHGVIFNHERLPGEVSRGGA